MSELFGCLPIDIVSLLIEYWNKKDCLNFQLTCKLFLSLFNESIKQIIFGPGDLKSLHRFKSLDSLCVENERVDILDQVLELPQLAQFRDLEITGNSIDYISGLVQLSSKCQNLRFLSISNNGTLSNQLDHPRLEFKSLKYLVVDNDTIDFGFVPSSLEYLGGTLKFGLNLDKLGELTLLTELRLLKPNLTSECISLSEFNTILLSLSNLKELMLVAQEPYGKFAIPTQLESLFIETVVPDCSWFHDRLENLTIEYYSGLSNQYMISTLTRLSSLEITISSDSDSDSANFNPNLIRNLTKLVRLELDVQFNQNTSWSILEKLTKLEELYLYFKGDSSHKIKSDVALNNVLFRLTSLIIQNYDYDDYDGHDFDLTSFFGMASLKKLTLNVETYKYIGRTQRNLESAYIVNDILHTDTYSKLKELVFDCNSCFDDLDFGLYSLISLERLTFVNYKYPAFGNSISELTSLTELSLRNMENKSLSSSEISHLKQVPKLKRIFYQKPEMVYEDLMILDLFEQSLECLVLEHDVKFENDFIKRRFNEFEIEYIESDGVVI